MGALGHPINTTLTIPEALIELLNDGLWVSFADLDVLPSTESICQVFDDEAVPVGLGRIVDTEFRRHCDAAASGQGIQPDKSFR